MLLLSCTTGLVYKMLSRFNVSMAKNYVVDSDDSAKHVAFFDSLVTRAMIPFQICRFFNSFVNLLRSEC